VGHFGTRRPLWNLEEGEKGKGTNISYIGKFFTKFPLEIYDFDIQRIFHGENEPNPLDFKILKIQIIKFL
jgi:hypothetical protein